MLPPLWDAMHRAGCENSLALCASSADVEQWKGRWILSHPSPVRDVLVERARIHWRSKGFPFPVISREQAVLQAQSFRRLLRARSADVLSTTLLCLIANSAPCETNRYSTVTITNQTPDIPMAAVIEIYGKPPEAFKQRQGTNVWAYNFPLKDNSWFNEADIKITWKNAYLNSDGSKKDFEQRIALRLRYDFPSDFDVPVYFSNDRTQTEMDRLEHKNDIHDQFEVFFRGGQIANFYAETNGRTHGFTKRAALISFWAEIKLAENPNYFVIMSNDTEQMTKEALGGSDWVSKRANKARSFYWEDARFVDGLVSKRKCDAARILLDTLRELSLDKTEAKRFAMRIDDPKLLDEKEIIVAKCVSVGTSEDHSKRGEQVSNVKQLRSN
jgi:hypothetical protein